MQNQVASNIHELSNGAAAHAVRETFESRFDKLDQLVSQLKAQFQAERARSKRIIGPGDIKMRRVAEAKAMLAERGSLLVADMRQAFGISTQTATRLMRAVARTGAGVLVFESTPKGDRLVLLHSHRVVIDRTGH